MMRLINAIDVQHPGTAEERISSKAFNTTNISVLRLLKISRDDAMSLKPGWRVAEIMAREVRTLDCILVLEPDPDMPLDSHAGIYQRATGGKPTKGQRYKLAATARLVA